MTYPDNNMPNYLFEVSDLEDARKLDTDFLSSKLGERIYLHAFHAEPPEVYSALREKYGITGRIRWIKLPSAVITDNT